MKQFLENFFRFNSKNSTDKPQITFEQNIATLMLLVAMADDEILEAEIQTIKKLLNSKLKLEKNLIDEIIKNAKELAHNSTDIYSFVRDINKNLKQHERQEIIKIFWEVVFADEKLSNMEDNIMRKICNLIGIDKHTYVYLKNEVKQNVLQANVEEND